MKDFLKAFAGSFLGTLAVFALAYWRFMVWFHTPLGPGLDIHTAQGVLPRDYTVFWLIVGSYFAIAAAVVVIELGLLLKRTSE